MLIFCTLMADFSALSTLVQLPGIRPWRYSAPFFPVYIGSTPEMLSFFLRSSSPWRHLHIFAHYLSIRRVIFNIFLLSTNPHEKTKTNNEGILLTRAPL